MGEGSAGFFGFAGTDADDVVGVGEDAAGAEESAEGAAPFEFAFDGFGEV